MYATQGIRCNAICPGGTATNIAESMPQDKLDPAGAARAAAFAALIPCTCRPKTSRTSPCSSSPTRPSTSTAR